MMADDIYEVHALHYASFDGRTRRETFLGVDDHDAAPMPVAYYVWVIRNAARTVVVDTGFDHAEGSRRGRALRCLPRDALATLGIDAATVTDVVITHLHYDHAGTVGDFPRARIHLQEAEMSFATGPCMGYREMRLPYSVDHVCTMVRRVFAGEVVFSSRRPRDLSGYLRSSGRWARQGDPMCPGEDGWRTAGAGFRHGPFL